MFVRTEKHGIINLNCYPRVDVVEDDGVWILKAFVEADRRKADFFSTGISLETFREEVQAEYSFCRLYSSLEAGLSVWDPSAVESFSGLWNKAKRELSSYNGPHVGLDTLELLELEITGFREITINMIHTVISEQQQGYVESKIKYTLNAVDPMKEAVWKIYWEDIEDVIPEVLV